MALKTFDGELLPNTLLTLAIIELPTLPILSRIQPTLSLIPFHSPTIRSLPTAAHSPTVFLTLVTKPLTRFEIIVFTEPAAPEIPVPTALKSVVPADFISPDLFTIAPTSEDMICGIALTRVEIICGSACKSEVMRVT